MAGRMWLGSSIPAGFFASPTGSSTGDGSIGDPWDIATVLEDGGNPAATIGPGDTVWFRAGTYTAPNTMSSEGHMGQWVCTLAGSAGSPITFRGYPGERAIIDGNYDAASPGNGHGTIFIKSPGKYLTFRDLEFTNSQTNRFSEPGGSPADCRADAFWITARYVKLINCIFHDCGEAFSAWAYGTGFEATGNLAYHNGFFQYQPEMNCEAAIDIPPAGGTAVAKSGSYSHSTAVASPLTFAHNNVAGDFLVVVAGVTGSAAYTNISATYNGVAMTRVNGKKTVDTNPVAVFGLTNPATGSHNVVITCSDGARVTGIAQSFVNADQTIGNTVAAGTWGYVMFLLPPFTTTAVSAANHMIVDGCFILNCYAEVGSYACTGDNTLIYAPGGGNGNPDTAMSYAPGAASVAMRWDWDPIVVGAGHNVYTQEGNTIDNCVATATDATLTSASNPWVAGDVGSILIVEGAGTAGAWLTTTIASFNGPGSIEMGTPAVTSVNPCRAKWAQGKLYKDNIFLDAAALALQTYGGSDSGFLKSEMVGNLLAIKNVSLGGLTNFAMTDTVYHWNCHWLSAPNIGYHMQHMTNYDVHDNYIHNAATVVASTYWESLNIGGVGQENTFVGPTTKQPSGDFSGDFPNNHYYTLGSPPATNVVFVRPNAYEANRANIYVYNWEDLTDVDVDLSSVIANGTPIYIMNAQDYFAAPVYSGVYGGGTVSVPMTGLTVAAAVNPTQYGTVAAMGPAFNAFIVRAQSTEPWR